jgi:hypothetical protein
MRDEDISRDHIVILYRRQIPISANGPAVDMITLVLVAAASRDA